MALTITLLNEQRIVLPEAVERTGGTSLILTHGFRKAGDKTPKREIDRAEACKKDFEGRVKHES
ncbi:MAG TPA: type II toxin-antitoxin system RelE/ParE family toxin [Nitrospiraceae bacterium]